MGPRRGCRGRGSCRAGTSGTPSPCFNGAATRVSRKRGWEELKRSLQEWLQWGRDEGVAEEKDVGRLGVVLKSSFNGAATRVSRERLHPTRGRSVPTPRFNGAATRVSRKS